ncbi:uncharacterized protein LY89DRAFT_339352 [Mollisia scopiformis]|uniref:Uncharacterized protein n=1 Tax=Mollisia scopiformis TaxID=149040 RepID=A0A132B8R7_MOLSC|nr:uncharacterized protein LY89DRAFT_339352 [Mollisia scopiformis]KUJ08274.1 hypothetical protein LY89DRAFT_339352 [Mollisia scopiformis]
MRRKAHTISSPKLPEDLQAKLEEKIISPKLERRKTFLDGQPSPRPEPNQTAIPLSLSLHRRRKSRGESPGREQTGGPLSLSLHSRRDSRSEMPKIEERRPVVESVDYYPPPLDTQAELAKAERRRSLFSAAERQQPPPEVKREESIVEETRSIVQPNQPQLTRLDAKPEFMKSEQRRSLLVGGPSVRPSWPERKTLFMNRERILAGRDSITAIPKPAYVDACVQTEMTDAEICAHLSSIPVPIAMPTIPLPPRSSVAIGSMADFFRGQYSLGDALRYV